MNFESTEKKLEIIFMRPLPSVRSDAVHAWQDIVAACGAIILDAMHLPVYDAYLLSESSLFVSESRCILITCGKTQLYKVFSLLVEKIGISNVAHVFYERKNFSNPEAQLSDFEAEIMPMLAHIPGFSYRLGPANGDHVHVFYASSDMCAQATGDDITVELLMNDLTPGILPCFYKDTASLDVLHKALSVSDMWQTNALRVQEHLFAPCGYSLNAVADAQYATFHITPQDTGTYASFETNCCDGTMLHLLDVLKPNSSDSFQYR